MKNYGKKNILKMKCWYLRKHPSLPTSPDSHRAHILCRFPARTSGSILTQHVKFLYAFFSIIGHLSPLSCVSRLFPKSYYHLLEMVGCGSQFKKICCVLQTLYLWGCSWKMWLHIQDERYLWWSYLEEITRELAFLASPYSLALTLNIDWFQPYSHTIYSVYLTIIVPWL